MHPQPSARTTMIQRFPAPMDADAPPAPRHSSVRRGAVVVAAVAVLAGLLAVGVAARVRQHESLDDTEEHARTNVRHVQVVFPEPAVDGAVTLPATLQAFQSTEAVARVDGYVKAWKADLGTRVKAGQVLAEIDTPELDQELEQTRAQLEQARAEWKQAEAELDEAKADVALAKANLVRAQANRTFAATTVERNQKLTTSKTIAAQDYDQSVRDHEARAADVDAAAADVQRRHTNLATRAAIIHSKAAAVGYREASVRRLQELQNFKTVVAPFDGVVTRRLVEVGMLVGGNGKQVLFSVTQSDVLRVQVAVPQSYAAPVRAGDEAAVIVPEYPGRVFQAKVTRTAGAVDAATRTLLTELELDNAGGELLPGAFGQVKLAVRRTSGALLVPANVLLTRTDGIFVAVVADGQRVRMQQVQLGRDYGPRVEVVTGLAGREALIVNPSDDLADGQRVATGETATR